MPEFLEVEYDVRCPRDGKLRGWSDSYEGAKAIAESRDKECGRCYHSHGPHLVVKRYVTLWEKA